MSEPTRAEQVAELSYLEPSMLKCRLHDKVGKAVLTGLRHAVNDHGAIDRNLIPSARKRIMGNIRGQVALADTFTLQLAMARNEEFQLLQVENADLRQQLQSALERQAAVEAEKERLKRIQAAALRVWRQLENYSQDDSLDELSAALAPLPGERSDA